MKPSRLRALRPVALVLVLVLPAQGVSATIPVIDVTNLIQNIYQVLQAIEQIRHLIAQLETMERNLERIANPSWRDLRGQFLYFNELTQQGQALSYRTENLFESFRELMAGYAALEPDSFDDVYGEWSTVTLDTLAATLDSAAAQAAQYHATQDQLAELQRIANSASGNLEALNASSMIEGHIAQEIAKLNQLLAASMNAQNVFFGMRLTVEASQEATQRLLIEESTESFHPYTGEGGFTGIPDGWPYPCFGCATRPTTP